MSAKLLGDWTSGTVKTVFNEFAQNRWNGDLVSGHEDFDVLLAWYVYEDYSGKAFVLYRDRRDGLLYTVEGSHCSCMGLEGQWSPVRVTVESLRFEMEQGRLGRDYDDKNTFGAELREVLDALNPRATAVERVARAQAELNAAVDALAGVA